MNINNEVAKSIIVLARSFGFDQRWIGNQLKVSQQLISKIANKKRNTTAEEIEKIGEVCGIHTDVFFDKNYSKLLLNQTASKLANNYEQIIKHEKKEYLVGKTWKELLLPTINRYDGGVFRRIPSDELIHKMKVNLGKEFKYFSIHNYTERVSIFDKQPTNGPLGTGDKPTICIDYDISEDEIIHLGLYFPDELNCSDETKLSQRAVLFAIACSFAEDNCQYKRILEFVKTIQRNNSTIYINDIVFADDKEIDHTIDSVIANLTGSICEDSPCGYKEEDYDIEFEKNYKAKDQYNEALYGSAICYIPIIIHDDIEIDELDIADKFNSIYDIFKKILDKFFVKLDELDEIVSFEDIVFDEYEEGERQSDERNNCVNEDEGSLLADFKLRIQKLNYMKEIGLITDDEYEIKRLEILDSI